MLISPIYLAGGMHDDWRDHFMDCFNQYEFFDPSSHGLTDEAQYTAWDLAHIRKAETVLAYMDTDNPSGYGLNLELGYAHALGKRIIFIDESDVDRQRYFGMARQVAHEVYTSMADAALALSDNSRLKEISKMNPWKPIVTAPKNGRHIALLTKNGIRVVGFWDNIGDDTYCWVATVDGEHPKCWTDGVCWASNEDDVPSDPPVLWVALPTSHQTGLNGEAKEGEK